MKLRYLSLTAALFAGLFTACDDSGANATSSIASYDTLPKFCDEGDTVKHSSTGILFYCKSGDWFEVGAAIPTAKSSSSAAGAPKSSEAKAGDTQSSDASGKVENPDGTESASSSSACTGRRCKTSSSSEGDSNSANSGNSSNSGTSTNSGSSNSGDVTDSSDDNSSASNSVASKPRDPYFDELGEYIIWKKFSLEDDGDRSETMGFARSRLSDDDFIAGIEGYGYTQVDLSTLTESGIELLGQTIGLTTPTLNDYRYLFVSKDDSDPYNVISYFVVGPTSAMATGDRTVEVGIYDGDIQGLLNPPSGNGCGDMWCGPYGLYRVETGLDAQNGDGTSGYWFAFADDGEGGYSEITWPVPLGNEYSDEAMDPVIDHCGGLCGTAVLRSGEELDINPFAGVGFAIAGETSTVDKTAAPADASDWRGICVAYTSDADIKVELSMGESVDPTMGYDVPAKTLPRSMTTKVINISWDDFTQVGWYAAHGASPTTGSEAAERLVYLKFRIQGSEGRYAFNIIGLGTFGSCR